MRKLKRCTWGLTGVVMELFWHWERLIPGPSPIHGLHCLSQDKATVERAWHAPVPRTVGKTLREVLSRGKMQSLDMASLVLTPHKDRPGVPWPWRVGRGAQQRSLEDWHEGAGVRMAKMAGSPCPHWPGSSCVITVLECGASVWWGH